MPDQPAHMTPEEFRRHGHAAIDWIADYWASLDDLPVRAQVAPGDVRRLLPASAPGGRRAVRRRAGRPRPRRRARPHALAAPAVLRLLPGQLLARRDPRRPPLQRHRCAGDDLGDEPGGDRGRAGGARLVRRGARAPGGVPQRRAGRRRHPGHRLHRDLHRPAVRAAPRERGRRTTSRRRRRRVAGLRVHAGPLVAGEGRDDGRPRRGRRPHDRRRPRHAGDGRRRAARRDRRRHRGGAATGDGAPRRRQHVDRRDGRHRRGRRGRARHGRLAARRRRLGRRRCGLSRAPRSPRRRRARGLVRHQPAQVAADDLRLQHLLGARPGRPDRRPVDPPGVPPQRGHRVGRGRRLPRLAPAARPAVPRDQAVGGAAHLRAARACASTSAAVSRSPSTSPTWSPPTTASRW